jgi:hypothetical protein
VQRDFDLLFDELDGMCGVVGLMSQYTGAFIDLYLVQAALEWIE